jgi:hypothetical protein
MRLPGRRRDRVHKHGEHSGYLTTIDAVKHKKTSFVSSSSAEMVWALEPSDLDLSIGKEFIDQPSLGLRDIAFLNVLIRAFVPPYGNCRPQRCR